MEPYVYFFMCIQHLILDDNTDVAGSSSGGADSFSDPDAWIQDNTQKRKISAGVFQTY